MIRRTTATVIVSLLGHALLFHVGLGEAQREAEAQRPGEPAASSITAAASVAARAGRLGTARRELVEEAREDARKGRLSLGRFLLRANGIDAEEAGEDFDQKESEARFEARLQALRDALKTDDVAHAVPSVFSDLRYRGEPGGLMGSALLEGSGSCEQIAQLVAAAVFDAGKPDEIALRYYGKPMDDGIAHLAPIALRGAEEDDLMTGRPAIRQGVRLAPADLVEVYARAHGLAPAIAIAASPSRAGQAAGLGAGSVAATEDARPPPTGPARPTLIAGFPPNNDRYPGALPLYSARAVKDPTDEPDVPFDKEAANDRARDCAYSVRMAMLSPPLIEVETNVSEIIRGVAMEPHRLPKPMQLEREASLLHAAESLAAGSATDDADRIMGWACLAALGEAAAVDFTLAGERRFADAAVEKHRRGREEGGKALAAIQWSTEDGQRTEKRLSVEFGGRTWLLLALPGGEDVMFRLLARGSRESWGRVSALAALVLWPATQTRALALIEKLPLSDQVDVMHEIFHAHDHMRPWATNFDLGDAPSASAPGAVFRRVYRVFRGLGWRLWEGQREIPEVLDALERESKRAGIDAAWEAALLDYCGRNALGLYSQRTSGMDIARAVKAAVRRNGHPSLATLQRQIDYIESQATLNARTLADAMRMK